MPDPIIVIEDRIKRLLKIQERAEEHGQADNLRWATRALSEQRALLRELEREAG